MGDWREGKGREGESTLKSFHEIGTLVWGWRAEVCWEICRVQCQGDGVLEFVAFKGSGGVSFCEPVGGTDDCCFGEYFLVVTDIRMKHGWGWVRVEYGSEVTYIGSFLVRYGYRVVGCKGSLVGCREEREGKVDPGVEITL